MKLKKVVPMLMAAAMVMGSVTVSADEPVVLTYADVNPIDSTDGMYATFFKEKVAELTDGAVVIDIQASGVLGAENDILDGMITGSGTVDLSRTSCYAFASYGCNTSALLGLPFIFESHDHFWNFTETELADQILNEPVEAGLGVRGLFWVEDGFRSFFFKDPVAGIEDMKDKKIRVSTDQIMTGLTEGIGASPTVVSFNELYTSLQSGVVDGAEQPIAPYESNAFYEVAPYFIKNEHTMATSEIVITDAAIAKLTEEQYAALQEAGKATQEYCREVIESAEAECIESLLENGVTFIEVEDKAPWRAACEDVIAGFIEGLETEYQTILDAVNA